MRGRKAKMIRRAVYGDYSPRVRQYSTDRNGTLHADARRKTYQEMKRRVK
jgi:hypothetical protein